MEDLRYGVDECMRARALAVCSESQSVLVQPEESRSWTVRSRSKTTGPMRLGPVFCGGREGSEESECIRDVVRCGGLSSIFLMTRPV